MSSTFKKQETKPTWTDTAQYIPRSKNTSNTCSSTFYNMLEPNPSIPTLKVFHQPSHTPATSPTIVVCLHSSFFTGGQHHTLLILSRTTSWGRGRSRGVFGLVEFVVVAVVFVLFWPCCVLNVTYTHIIPTCRYI